MRTDGNIPVITIRGKTLPEVWEESVIVAWKQGIEIATQYDKEGDPPSKDCAMVMVVQDPMAEPRIHRAIPGGLEDLEIYRQEVVDGIHDHWVDTNDPAKWDYTYHGKLFDYWVGDQAIDQINNYLIPAIAKVPYSRRVQAVTWQAWHDPGLADPPCLQRLWVRMLKNDAGIYVLNMHTYWRSRDAYKAAFMNMFAMVSLQEMIANKVSEILGEPVIVGPMVDISDSYHIYGSYWKDAGDASSFQGFLKTIEVRTFKQRTWTMEFAEPMFEEARAKLLKERRE